MASTENKVGSNLYQQDLSKLNINKLSALSPEVISRQATINIGTIGHVAHGKSTVVKAISGVQTVRFKNELERNITIKLERLTESQMKLLRDRYQEKEEHQFLELYKKQIIKKRTSLSSETSSKASEKTPQNSKAKAKEEYVIETVVDEKFVSGKLYYEIKWQGYSDEDNTWEPVENLSNCPLKITEYIFIQEVIHHGLLRKLIKELSFGDLLHDDILIANMNEYGLPNLLESKEKLIMTLLAILKLSPNEENYVANLVTDARRYLQQYTLARKRSRQLIEIKKWETNMNEIDTAKKITVDNFVDFAGPPTSFQYVNENIPDVGVTIPQEPPIGCECESCNVRAKDCCGTQGGFFAYTAKKILRLALGTPIFECNKACKCSSECNNRVVQKGRTVKLCVYRTANGCGWGVKAEQPIKDGQFLCQYVGQVITSTEAEKRGREYDANGLTYLFDLDFNSTENPYTIDAAKMGNISHFINHSCEPNLAVWAVWADCLDPNLPMLALFATRDIQAGEQLCFDYLQKANDVENINSENMVNGRTPEKSSPLKRKLEDDCNHGNRTECKCGTEKCRRYLF